jgi:hypothetical protein
MDPRYDAELARLLDGRLQPTTALMAVGDRVRLTCSGKYAGLTGTVEKRGRSRYQVRTRAGLLNVAFTAAQPVTAPDRVRSRNGPELS